MFEVGRGTISRMGLVIGLLLLSDCHKKPDRPAPAERVESTPVVAPKPLSPRPPRRPGLWETTLSEEGSAERQILKISIDALTDERLGILGTDLSGDSCSRKTFSPQGAGSWGLLAECAMGAGVVTEYSGSVTGDFDSQYDMNVRSQTIGGSQMNRVTNYVVHSRRLGACAPDQKPGDVINDGVKMNLFGMEGVNRGRVKASESPSSDGVD